MSLKNSLFLLGILSLTFYSCGQKSYLVLEEPYVIRVTGQNYEWHVQYPGKDGLLNTADDIKDLKNIVLPSKTKVTIEITSKDNLYFFDLPGLNKMASAIPDRVTTIHLNSKKNGAFKIRGNQMCGFNHASLYGELQTLSFRNFAKWHQKKYLK